MSTIIFKKIKYNYKRCNIYANSILPVRWWIRVWLHSGANSSVRACHRQTSPEHGQQVDLV